MICFNYYINLSDSLQVEPLAENNTILPNIILLKYLVFLREFVLFSKLVSSFQSHEWACGVSTGKEILGAWLTQHGSSL